MKTPDLCVTCKGTKKLCGLNTCPLLNKIRTQHQMKKEIKEEVFGPSNEVFVGSFGYPNLSVGPMVSTFGQPLSPDELYGMEYDKIIQERTKLLRGKRFVSVGKRLEDQMQEVSLSMKSLDVEMRFSKKPLFDLRFSSVLEPMGASAPIRKYRVTDNPKIPKKVDSVLEEDMLAVNAIDELYSYGFDNYYLTRIMSAGALGKKENKKIVPTRWSITSVQSIISKKLIKKIKDYKQISTVMMFRYSHFGNSYFVLLLPGAWEFENFEAWSPTSIWAKGAKEYVVTEEYEPYEGRTKYAFKQVGAYYAVRLAVTEYLNFIKRQARVIVIREIDEKYIIPLGVSQVLEGVRGAFKDNAKIFLSLNEALNYISNHLIVTIKKYKSMSKIMNQKKLSDFIN